MRKFGFGVAVLAALTGTAAAAPRNDAYDEMIQRYAKMHDVPEALVHRIIMRESRYNPGLTNRRRYFGLMQISVATARSMGYAGTPAGLLDPDVNLTYGVPYLANAYHVAEKNADRAVALYAGGYYFVAKRRHMLATLRTAKTSPVVVEEAVVPAAAAPVNPLSQLVHFLAGDAAAGQPAEAAQPAPEAAQAEVVGTAAPTR